MKRMKKIFAMLLAFTMVLGMSMTTFAAIENPSSIDKAEVTVSGLEKDVVVNAYQIVDADYYKEGEAGVGFKGYVVVDKVKSLLADNYEGDKAKYNFENPNPDHITTIANALAKGELNLGDGERLVYDETSEKFEKELEAGAWIIIVTNTGEEMFNPMLAGVYYTNATGEENDIAGGNINADGEWKLPELTGTAVYAKSTIVPNFVKEIVNSNSGNNVSDDVAIGDDVSFKITTAIPAYSKSYKDLTFTITDTLETGLTFNNDAKVTIDGAEDATAYTLKVEGQVMTIAFNDAGIRNHGGDEVVIEYTAKVNENAELDFNQNTNTASLDYTNNPNGTTGHKEDETHHHTFDFQIKKTDEASAVLKDAEFTLYSVVDADTEGAVKLEEGKFGKQLKVATSVADTGLVTFSGLDTATYYLKETKAPLGYQIDNTVRTVVISATYDETEGTIKTYSITIDGTAVESWEKSATSTADATINMLTVMNTKLIALPSTGGIGTTIFTVAGCGIMIAAAFFFFASRKKEN